MVLYSINMETPKPEIFVSSGTPEKFSGIFFMRRENDCGFVIENMK